MTYEIDNDIALKVLQLIYDSWFKDFYAGIAIEDIIANTKKDIAAATDNQINQAVNFLETHWVIIKDDISRYKITANGIDAYEKSLALEVQTAKKHERTKILKILAEKYKINTGEWMHSEALREEAQIEDPFYLLILVTYLNDKNLIDLKKYSGTLFYSRLSPEGFEFLKDPISDNTELMTNAYQLLFRLENYLREFIKDKLISKYKDEWWEKGATDGVKKSADRNKTSELSEIWQISDTKSNMDYLYFEHLGSIIENNWDLFNITFNDQLWVKSRLVILEKIRNAIAHTRTLTTDSKIRLDQNVSDLMGKINK